MSRKNKKYSDSRLREIALMISHGLPAKLIAELTGLPPRSVANICGIYKWSPEMLDEMTERVKLSGKIGGYARVDLRKYFIMHPEQRPAPHLQLFSEDQKEAVEVCQSEPPETMREADRDFDGDFKRALCQKFDAEKPPYLKEWPIERRVTRLEDLANCFRCEFNQLKIARDNHEERLSANHKRIEAFQRFVDEMPVLPAAKLESTIGSLVAEMAAKDHQIDKLQDELTAQRRTLGLLSARVESLENHRQDLSWRVAKQEQNQTALLYNDSANKISADQFKTLSDKVGNLTERLRIAEKILKQDVIDGNAHSRIDLLARCSGDQNERIEELKAQADKLEERSHIMAKCSDDQVLELHKRFDAMTPKIEALVTQVTHLTRKYDELSTEQVRPVIDVDHRLDAMTRQIERLQDILTSIRESLPREFD